MIEQALIISLLVLAIHYTMQEGEIFEGLSKWFEKTMPYGIHQPLFECNVCMTPWYGSVLYVLIYGVSWQCPVVVITAMGLNIIYNRVNVTGNELDEIEDKP